MTGMFNVSVLSFTIGIENMNRSDMTRSTALHTLVCFALLLIGLFALGTPLTANAQNQSVDKEAAKERVAAQIDSLVAHLDLSEGQEQKVRPILEESMEKRMERLQDFREENEGKSRRSKRRALKNLRSDMETLNEETQDQLAEHLTDEQMQEYQEYREEQRKEMREQMRSRRGG